MPKRKRAHQPIEIFQLRNKELIAQALTAEGYDALNAHDEDEDDWTEEAEGGIAARRKATKSARMRMRTRVVGALWNQASAEEQKAVAEVVEAEKKEMMEAELEAEKGGQDPTASTPEEFQE